MSAFPAVAREFADAFTSDTRNDGATFWKLRDDCADWVTSDTMLAIHQALDDRLPDDWVYKIAAHAADSIADEAENNPDSFDLCADASDVLADRITEIADGLVDVYHVDRARWLASHLNNQSLVDEAGDELGRPDSISEQIALGQFRAIECLCQAIVSACNDEAQSRDDDEGTE